MCAATDVAAQLASAAGLGRLLTLIENDAEERARVLRELPLAGHRAHRIGITGSPGVGKSTLLGRLVPLLTSACSTDNSTSLDNSTEGQGSRVKGQGSQDQTSQHARNESIPLEPGTLNLKPAILAIDPTSEQTGGAVLADRFRWNELPAGVFVRSLASRGSLAGVSSATDAAVRVLEAAGYDPILIETVGVGQTGFEIRQLADTVVVLLSPESGDALQLLKAGLIETGDIFVVNKADRPGADALLTDLRSALDGWERRPLGGSEDAGVPPALPAWQPRVLAVSALNGEGVTELAAAIDSHMHWLHDNPHASRDAQHAALESAARAKFETQLAATLLDSTDLLARLNSGEIDLEAAALALLARLPR